MRQDDNSGISFLRHQPARSNKERRAAGLEMTQERHDEIVKKMRQHAIMKRSQDSARGLATGALRYGPISKEIQHVYEEMQRRNWRQPAGMSFVRSASQKAKWRSRNGGK